ncbi:AAA family ATPase [Gorillibacterium sp. sgz500922]|uniref:AAA family ATPase n=1 Tax=Gorillibacterium sp. sgz500922 TaxID=3446694 RepID=UPI003F666027
MKLLIGTSHPEAYLRFGDSSQGRLQAVTVSTAEQALFRLSESFDHAAFELQLFADWYPWEVIRELSKQRGPHTSITLIPDDKVYDSLYLEVLGRLADSAGIALLPQALTPQEGAALLLERLTDSPTVPRTGQGKVVAVWSAGSRDGASTVVANTALLLASQTGLRVGLLDLNLKNPTLSANLNLETGGKSNVRLRPRLQTRTLTPEELRAGCIPLPRMKQALVLPGTPRRDSAGDCTPEMIDHLLTAARSAFDVTLLDLNGYPDNAATVCGVRGADLRWLVATPRFDSYRTSWTEWYNSYWKFCGLSPEDIGLVLNRAAAKGEANAAATFLEMPLAAELPELPGEHARRAVDEGVPFHEQTGAEPFREALAPLAAQAARAAGTEWELRPDRRKTLWRRIGGRLAWN